MPGDTPEQIHAKADAFAKIQKSPEFERLSLACNIYTAAFFQPFSGSINSPITTESLRSTLADQRLHDARVAASIDLCSSRQSFFHWRLAFPEVFAAGGFDVVIGNPPFMGGLKISTRFGDKYWSLLTHQFPPFASTADLCAAFFRRAFSCLRSNGILE